jgi:hypothetical protein
VNKKREDVIGAVCSTYGVEHKTTAYRETE